MLSGGWKEFAFFDVTPVRDPSPVNELLFSDPKLLQISVASTKLAYMLTRYGLVKEFTEDMQLRRQFSIYDAQEDRSPDFLYLVPQTSLLLTCSSKSHGPVELKVWDLSLSANSSEKTDELPKLHAQTHINNKTNTFPLTAHAVSPDLSVIALGFGDGSVIIVRGDLKHDRGTKQRNVYNASTDITGLHLTSDYSQVYVASLSQIAIVSTTATRSINILDRSRGAALKCAGGAANHDLVVAHDSDVVYYHAEHRGASFELSFTKRQIYVPETPNFLVIVGAFEPATRGMLATESTRVVIVDLANHLVAFNQPLGTSGITTIFEAWGRLNVVANNGIMYVLREKPWRSQIELLKQRNLYQVAIEMVKRRQNAYASAKAPQTSVEENAHLEKMLHQDYADYLFSKNDLEASLQEYILSIGLGQTSHAIRRFKDSQHASILLAYLSALFERGKSTPPHVTLQIICYTKLGPKYLPKLQQFLAQVVETMPDFDFDRAISALTEMKSAEYAELAARLAAKYPDPDRCVQIRLRQLNDVKGVLDYIQTVSVADALRILIQNSRLMLNQLPVETTGVLITLFTGKFTTKTCTTNETSLFASNLRPASPPNADTDKLSFDSAPLLQSYQAFINFLGSASYLGNSIVSVETLQQEVSEPSYLPPRPSLIFPSFINHDNEFVIFLEACLEAVPRFSAASKDLNDIASTLFETYLRVGAKERANALVNQHAGLLYPVNVLTACEQFKFRLSNEQQHQLGMALTDIFRAKLEANDTDAALAVLDQADADLAAIAPKLLAKNKSALQAIGRERFLMVLNHAISVGKLSYYELIADLSRSPYLTVGDLRPFIQQFLSTSADQINRQTKLANSYLAEIDETESKSRKTADGDVMTVNYGDCAQCNLSLDLPATHFACQHSYHQSCLPQESPECLRCLPEQENANNLRREAEEAAANEAYFFEALEKRDSAKVIWEFISRGALSIVK